LPVCIELRSGLLSSDVSIGPTMTILSGSRVCTFVSVPIQVVSTSTTRAE
jgi:hypothetical protein